MRLVLAMLLAGSPAMAEAPEMIDATKLSVAELLALAADARADASAHGCCDWGGMGCRVEAVSRVQARRTQPAAPAIPLIAVPDAPE